MLGSEIVGYKDTKGCIMRIFFKALMVLRRYGKMLTPCLVGAIRRRYMSILRFIDNDCVAQHFNCHFSTLGTELVDKIDNDSRSSISKFNILK